MTSTFPYGRSKTVLRLNPGRLWAGGVATAVIAALIVIVGISIARGIFGVPMPVPAPNHGMSAIAYVGIAVGAAIAATALLHLLMVGAPRPLAFFAWIVFLATVLGVLAPFSNSVFGSFSNIAYLNSKSSVAAINLVVGIAIGTLLTSVARSSVSRQPAPPPPSNAPPTTPMNPSPRLPADDNQPTENDYWTRPRDR
jgi:hypothetical protein